MRTDIQKATDRVRDAIVNWSIEMWIYDHEFSRMAREDVQSIMRAWCDEHPADESEPITPDWCNANSLRHEDEWRWAIHDNPHICILNGKAGGWSLHLYPFDVDDDWDALVLREDIKTRGDVLAFLRGMGIDTKGGA